MLRPCVISFVALSFWAAYLGKRLPSVSSSDILAAIGVGKLRD